MRTIALALAILTTAAMLSACFANTGSAQVAALSDVSIREAIIEPDPQAAVDAIYAALPNSRTTSLDTYTLDKIGINTTDIQEYYGCVTDPAGGLSDVIMLLPKFDKREAVLEQLNQYKLQRIREFENFDILDAYSIAQNAIIYNQGDFLILLMLEDNESTQNTIDEYMPQ